MVRLIRRSLWQLSNVTISQCDDVPIQNVKVLISKSSHYQIGSLTSHHVNRSEKPPQSLW